MELTLFESTGLEELNKWLDNKYASNFNINDAKDLLKTCNISFALEGINRLQSTLLCELKDSYVQQSQRYVTMEENYHFPLMNKMTPIEKNKTKDLISDCFDLYERMTELKDGVDPSGRPKKDDYKYGIPVEDARYILPLVTKTNISVTMTGDKLFDLYNLLTKYPDIIKNILGSLIEYIPVNIKKLIVQNSKLLTSKVSTTYSYYGDKFKELSPKNKVELFDMYNNPEIRVGIGAATSTSEMTPSEKLNSWGQNKSEKSKKLVENVLGYGHTSITEQSRTVTGMMFSLVTYHQYIRHRLPKNHREPLIEVVKRTDSKNVVVPKTIQESKFEDEYKTLVEKTHLFRERILKVYGVDAEYLSYLFLLNCDQIKVISSTNARIDNEIMNERLCMNAQWEIRDIYIERSHKLKQISEILYKGSLPDCMVNGCNEGGLSCDDNSYIKNKLN